MIVSQLTPPGPGGVALLRCEGEGSRAFLERAFCPSHGNQLPRVGRVALGQLKDARGETVDEILLSRPGPEQFEIGCHGGPAIVRSLLECFRHAGASMNPEPLSGLADDQDRVHLEASAALLRTTTALGCRVLLEQMRGSLANAVRDLIGGLDSEPERIKDELKALLATARFGLALLNPPRISLCGLPNAGKSSLMNALLGKERVIVSVESGTTRDAVEEITELSGCPAVLVDTAGQHSASDPLEAEGIARARHSADSAACRLLVLDASMPSAEAFELARTAPAPRVLALNKVDLLSAGEITELTEGALANGLELLRVSAKTEAGLEELRGVLRERLVGSPAEEGAVVFTTRQRGLLEGALRAMESAQIARARDCFRALLGAAP